MLNLYYAFEVDPLLRTNKEHFCLAEELWIHLENHIDTTPETNDGETKLQSLWQLFTPYHLLTL